MAWPYTRPLRHTRFTLVELLVVIAIITVLAALVTTAAATARARARATRCGGQMRQIGLAIQMYANDHDDQLPSAARLGPDTELPSLRQVLAGQDDTPALWHCPADSGDLALFTDPAIGTSYEWNTLVNGRKIDRATFQLVGLQITAPILRDAEAWHPGLTRNFCHTDGHVSTDAHWEITP